MPAGGLPDFLIVGHQKSGTTALFQMLRRHPQVFMPDIKEAWFFAEELRERTPPRPQGVPETLADYKALFAPAGAGQRKGEASAQYLWSATAAARIAAAAPDARIVAILREPASFLRSLHLQFVQTNIEPEADLERALALEPRRREGRELPRHTYWPRMLLYSEHVRYVEQLRRYHALFPAEQVKVLIYEDFRADNAATVREILRFLEVDESVSVETVRANPTVSPRSQRLNELVHAVGVGHGPLSRAAKASLKALTPAGPRRRAFYAVQRRLVFAPAAPPDERLMGKLRAGFREEVEALSEYLGRDLRSVWGYEQR
ncbi:MAG TPA: sulfotransferase [Solirubrobacteraceae bacterium]|nr:sulfotransferase [Solirubrobacteraceae bacterium]